MTEKADARRVALVVHELSHAIVGRALGQRIRLVVTSPGASTGGWCEHHPAGDSGPLLRAIDGATILLAGEEGAELVPLKGYGDLAPPEAITASVLDALPPEDGGFVYAAQADDRPRLTDREQAVALIRAVTAGPSAEERALLVYCRERARRIVGEHVPMIRALVPAALAHPVLTGDAIEQAIAAQLGRKEF